MRPRGSPSELERRRRRAIDLLQKGQTYRAVAQSSGAALSSVVRWFQAFRRRGLRGLLPKPTPGRPCRLQKAQKRHLERILLRGAQKSGYSTELWTLRRISEVIKRAFGIRYSISAVWRLLVVDLKWSTQKPERRATQRDEAAIEKWRKEEWPRLKKNTSAGRLPRFCRRKRLSVDPDGSTHMGSQRQDTASLSQLSKRPHFHHSGSDGFSAPFEIGRVRPVPFEEHHRCRSRCVSPRLTASPSRTDRPDMGWRLDPSSASCAGLYTETLRETACVSLPRLCP